MKTSAQVQLDLYNNALRMCGERTLASLTENREPRRLLDAVWADNLIDTMLEEGQWIFATRAVSLTYSPSVEPAYGYSYAFNQPTDMIRVTGVYEDDKFNFPLNQYMDVGGYWFSDFDTIYIKYVSNDPAYGGDLSLWTNRFQKFVSAYMALEIAPRLTQAENRITALQKEYTKRRTEARSLEAMKEPTKKLPDGSWVRSRWGRTNDRSCDGDDGCP